jgi:hypothetical protein
LSTATVCQKNSWYRWLIKFTILVAQYYLQVPFIIVFAGNKMKKDVKKETPAAGIDNSQIFLIPYF